MSTQKRSPALEKALANVSSLFRAKLIKAYLELKQNFAEHRYDTAGVSTGKYCEVAIRLLQHKVLHTCTPFGKHINNFADECQKLVQAPATAGNESERVVIPRALAYLYTMRNKRGIGHVGGDIDANAIDIATMVRIADWIMCELIRINHGLSLEQAQDIVDGIFLRQLLTVWEVSGKKRVLKDGLKTRDQTLLLLYSCEESVILVEDLCSWVEYSNLHIFKNKVLAELHKQRLIEHDKETDSVFLSPKGADYVEKTLL
jgi:hypothetical protein